jgi:hypothetical protein
LVLKCPSRVSRRFLVQTCEVEALKDKLKEVLKVRVFECACSSTFVGDRLLTKGRVLWC